MSVFVGLNTLSKSPALVSLPGAAATAAGSVSWKSRRHSVPS
jgi:hypothetical protein